MLYDNRIRPHSDRVLTHRNYALGPIYIAQLMQGRDNIGLTYKLIDVNTGKSFKRLVPADRLKPYTADRTDLLARLPTNLHKEQQAVDTTGTDQNQKRRLTKRQTTSCPGAKPRNEY